MMTREQTDNLRSLLKDVTPGPWEADDYGQVIYATDPYGKGKMHVADIRGWGHLTGQGMGACKLTDAEAVTIQRANMVLMTETRNIFESLLDTIDEMREVIELCQFGSNELSP